MRSIVALTAMPGRIAVAVRRDPDVVRAHVRRGEPILLPDGRRRARLIVPRWTCPSTTRPWITFAEPTKPGDERRGRVVVDLRRRAHLLDLALVHHDDLVGELQRLLLVVRDEEAGHAELAVELVEPAPEVLADPCVERAERLVEQQHLRLGAQRPRERDALPLATGQLVGVPVARTARAARAPGARRRAAFLAVLRLLAHRAGRTRRSGGPSCAGTARSAGTRTRPAVPARACTVSSSGRPARSGPTSGAPARRSCEARCSCRSRSGRAAR